MLSTDLKRSGSIEVIVERKVLRVMLRYVGVVSRDAVVGVVGARCLCLSLSFFCVPCVVLGPAVGQRTDRLFVTTGSPLSLYTLFLSCIPSGLLVPSLCWSINWTHHRTDRHRTARTSNSNMVL